MLRRTLLSILAVLLTCALCAPVFAAAPAAKAGTRLSGSSLTMLYGDNHVFAVVPPKGWVVDDTSGMGSKIRVVLYPLGQKWATAPTVMYENPLHQDPASRLTLAQMIDRDVASFRRQAPKGKVTSAPQIRTLKGQTAEVRYFSPDGHDPLTAVAYLEETDMVILLVLESKTADGLRSALQPFHELITGYQFVAGGVKTPTSTAGAKR